MNPTLKEDLTLLNDVIKSIRKKLKKKEYDEKRYETHRKELIARAIKWGKLNKNKVRENHKNHRIRNREYKIKYREKNKKLICEYHKQWQQKNKEYIRRKRIEWQSKNIDRIKEYRDTNKEHHRQLCRAWKHNHKEYLNEKRRTDVNYRLSVNLRSRVNKALKGNYKSGSAVKDLGCTIPELKRHLESKFQEGMTWDNWSFIGWHIDHIKPLSSFDLTDRKQLLEACHYTNLQPLWANDNLSKGDKY